MRSREFPVLPGTAVRGREAGHQGMLVVGSAQSRYRRHCTLVETRSATSNEPAIALPLKQAHVRSPVHCSVCDRHRVFSECAHPVHVRPWMVCRLRTPPPTCAKTSTVSLFDDTVVARYCPKAQKRRLAWG